MLANERVICLAGIVPIVPISLC